LHRRFVLAVVAIALALGVPPARAQTSHIEASIRASQARASIRHGDLNEAARLFRESITLDENPRVIREFAELLERMGSRREAAENWTRVAALAPFPTERDAAIARRETLRRAPSMLRVRVLPALAARNARVWFDHDAPRFVPVGGAESVVEGGPHRVRVESPGYASFERMVTTAYGEPVDIVAELRAGSGDAGVR
jgi:hypothetical protein